MSIALDIGVSRIRSLRRGAEGLVLRRVRPVYTVLPDSPSYRDMLVRMPVPYALCDDALLMLVNLRPTFPVCFSRRSSTCCRTAKSRTMIHRPDNFWPR